MAAILAFRKLAQYDGGQRGTATISAIADSIGWAEEIMDEIDRRSRAASSRSGSREQEGAFYSTHSQN
jgi:hypothetical protein